MGARSCNRLHFGFLSRNIYEAETTITWSSSFPFFLLLSRFLLIHRVATMAYLSPTALKNLRMYAYKAVDKYVYPIHTNRSSDYCTDLLYPDTFLPPTGIGSSPFGR